MNDPKDQPIDIEEQREWLKAYREAEDLSWKALSRSSGIPASTLGLFASSTYSGNNAKVAENIFRHRQKLVSQRSLKGKLPKAPAYYQTPTSEKIIGVLSWAQRGRIVLVPMAAGLGKTMTAEHYKACNSNVYLCTCSPATASVHSLQRAVLMALGSINLVGSMQVLSSRIIDLLKDKTDALLILDEAQHLTTRALEEVRGWHDASKVGVALMGNESILPRIEGANRSSEFAQLFSRIANKIPQSKPEAADVEMLLDAWEIRDEHVSTLIHRIATKPGALRVATFTLEMAVMLATVCKEDLNENHVHEAWLQLSSRGGSV